MADIAFQTENDLTVDAFIDVLNRSTLAERRPVDNREQIQKMLEHADLIVTARADSQLIGVARSISDFSYCTYLSDLAVVQSWQKQGVGTRLIDFTRDLIGASQLILLSAPTATEYYPRIGMSRHDSCWTFPAK